MKRIAIVAISLIAVIALIVGVSTAMAAKPQDAGTKGMDVIAKSNGFPSGKHFNLNIHGKDWETCQAVPDEDGSWGSSIHIPEYGTATIEYVSNKKSSVTQLKVLDPCGGFDGPKDAAKIQLPAPPKGTPPDQQGYHAFARILGKPQNGKVDPDGRSYIALSPNKVLQACNDADPLNDEDGFGDLTECDTELSLGLIMKDAVYEDTGEEFWRFDDPQSKGRGKSVAVDITRLFTFTGWVIDASLDIYPAPDGDGAITKEDIPLGDYDGDPLNPDSQDYNNDGLFNDDDLYDWLNDLAALADPMAWFFENEWILNIADLVIAGGEITNDGTKLLQIRFYPLWEVEYVE